MIKLITHTMYFDVLYQIIKLLQSKFWRTYPFQEAAYRSLGINWSQVERKTILGYCDLDYRRRIVLQAYWVLEVRPKRFISICENAGMSSIVILKDFETPPFWYYKVVMDNSPYFRKKLNSPANGRSSKISYI